MAGLPTEPQTGTVKWGDILSFVILTTEAQRTQRKTRKLCALRVSVVKIAPEY